MNSEDFNKLNNIPNPYDPSTNNNININFKPNTNNVEVKEESQTNPFSIENNNPFNQTSNTSYKDVVDQSNNYNINYNSNAQTGKPEKSKMWMKYIIFALIILVVSLIIFIVSKFA